MAFLKIIFLDNKEKEHCLTFRLSNSDISSRWQRIVKVNQQSNKTIHTVLMNTTYEGLSKIHTELEFVLYRIKEMYDRTLPLISGEELTRHQLNVLHEHFELYGDRILELQEKNMLSRDVTNDEMHIAFCRLNELIHSYEDGLANKNLRFPRMSALIDYYPAGIYEPLLERDRIHLASDFKWGSLYLGYNTLGKDWASVWVDNDLEVIERNQARPQKRFAAETWINFGADLPDFERREEFEKWYLKLPKELQSKIPMDNYNELSFGRIHIGDIVIDDYFLKYESNPHAWQLPSSDAKRNWNYLVFSTFTKAISVDIYE